MSWGAKNVALLGARRSGNQERARMRATPLVRSTHCSKHPCPMRGRRTVGEQVVAVLRAVRFLDLLQLAHEAPDGQIVVEHLEVVVLLHRLQRAKLLNKTPESRIRS